MCKLLENITVKECVKVGLGAHKGLSKLHSVLDCLPASIPDISQKTGLSEGSIRRYFCIANKLKIRVINNKNGGAYFIKKNRSEKK